MRALWILIAAVGLLWTAISWFLAMLVGSGGRAVVTITRWLSMEPSSTQWLADTLGSLGGAAQILIWLIWAAGVAVLLGVGFRLGGAARDARTMMRDIREEVRLREDMYRAEGTVHEGEVRERRIDDIGGGR